MTDQQPHTPDTEVVKDAACFPRDRLGEPRGIDTDAFDRWLATVEAAAEQRGAERALVDAAKTLREVSPESDTPLKNMPGNVPVYMWLAHRAEKYRADQMEGDDE